MAKGLCILHANCQGEALRPLLEGVSSFANKFEIRHYLNYTREELADLEKCELYLYQYLGPAWGEYSTDQLLQRMPPQAQAICLPNFFFKGYWPFWTNHFQDIEFADSLLEKLLASGLDETQAMHLYLKGAAGLFGDIEAVARESLAQEREKEQHTPLKYVDILAENWRQEQLFFTVNHPAPKLLEHTAGQLLKTLDLGDIPQSVINNYQHPQGDFHLPIHPAVSARLKLAFGHENTLYPCFGRPINFADYVRYYLACRSNKVEDLTGMLRERGRRKDWSC